MQPNKQARSGKRIGCLTVLLILVLAPVVAWKGFEYHFRLGLIPQDLGVYWISYARQESWGFGPGGNETGLIVYSLPDATARAVIDGGAAYLGTLDSEPRRPRERRNSFGEWRRTPIEQGELARPASIAQYLNRYGFGIAIDPAVEAYVNSVISSPGSFYAYARIGIVIVDPKAGKVVFADAG